jgi:uncharacterized MAPEG superfamily protein
VKVPVWTLLGFATWTLLLLFATVGVYRWSRILIGREPIASFRGDGVQGADWYRRAMRAHANCVENLPVFGAIVFALYVGGVGGPLVNQLCIAVLVIRVLHSLWHVAVPQNDAAAAVRFLLYFAQIVCFLWLIGIILARHGGVPMIVAT